MSNDADDTASFREYLEDGTFSGVVGRTAADSVPAWPVPVRAPAGSPNVVVVLLDDVGFADFGCFGGAIRTPTFDRLAAGGVRYRDFHTTALCAPSRACLLTGRNHHVNGTGSTVEDGFPGYNMMVPRQSGFLSEILRARGYATFALGKWHLTPFVETGVGSSKARWPLSRGFDRFYGFLRSATSQWIPDLVYDNHQIAPPRSPEDGYHLNVDMADRAIEFVSDLRAVEPAKPFFLYYCPGACHVPHHVPREWADRYAGKFDQGWDRLRDEVFARQLDMGIVPEGTTLSERPDSIAAWDSLSDDERRLCARQMEVYAGFLEHTDHHIGRVVDFLEQIGELDNTIFIVTSDNGAAGSGGAGYRDFGVGPEAGTDLDGWGGPGSYPIYSSGWGWMSNTPLRRWKRYVHEGGVSDPLIVHWPTRVRARGEVRGQYAHITDIAPTLLDVLEIAPPAEIGGVHQSPIHGVSFAHTFDDPEASTNKRVQYYEMFGSRAIWADGWKAVTEQADVPLDEEGLANQRWELFHTADDVSECHDLADQQPEKLRQLVEVWWAEAGKHGVLPLHANDRRHRGGQRRQTPIGQPPRSRFVYYPGAARLPRSVAVDLARRSHRITAHVEVPNGGAEGILVAHGGGPFGGWAFYIKDGRLTYAHSYLDVDEQKVTSDGELPTGTVAFRVDLAITDDQANVALHANGRQVGHGQFAKTVHQFYGRFDHGLCCGYDEGEPVTRGYQTPFSFTGAIREVVIELKDSERTTT